MSLLQKVKQTFGVAETAEMHRYECKTCYAKFDTTEDNPSLVTCESCGSSDVEQVSED